MTDRPTLLDVLEKAIQCRANTKLKFTLDGQVRVTIKTTNPDLVNMVEAAAHTCSINSFDIVGLVVVE